MILNNSLKHPLARKNSDKKYFILQFFLTSVYDFSCPEGSSVNNATILYKKESLNCCLPFYK